MIQPILGGSTGNTSGASTTYNVPMGGDSWNTSIAVMKQLICAGMLSYFHVELNAEPGAGTSYDFTVVKNGVDTAITLNIADTATSGTYSGAGVSVVEGDNISIKCAPINTPTNRRAAWVLTWEGTTANESNLMSCAYCNNSQTDYWGLIGGSVATEITTETEASQIIPTNGTISRLFVELSADPGTNPDAYSYTIYKNGVATLLTVTVTADNKTGSDITNSVSVVAGDLVSLEIIPVNTPSVQPRAYTKVSFTATTDGESCVLGGTNIATSNSTTRYLFAKRALQSTTPNATESLMHQKTIAAVLKKFYVNLNGTPGAGKSYDITIRVNDTSSILTLNIADSATSANDTATNVNVSNNDSVDIEITPNGTPTARKINASFVSYIAPVVTDTSKFFLLW